MWQLVTTSTENFSKHRLNTDTERRMEIEHYENSPVDERSNTGERRESHAGQNIFTSSVLILVFYFSLLLTLTHFYLFFPLNVKCVSLLFDVFGIFGKALFYRSL